MMWCPYVTKKLIAEKLYLWLQFLGDLMCFHLVESICHWGSHNFNPKFFTHVNPPRTTQDHILKNKISCFF
jgi:hypothetical protein